MKTNINGQWQKPRYIPTVTRLANSEETERLIKILNRGNRLDNFEIGEVRYTYPSDPLEPGAHEFTLINKPGTKFIKVTYDVYIQDVYREKLAQASGITARLFGKGLHHESG
jgi:hypothetical protein